MDREDQRQPLTEVRTLLECAAIPMEQKPSVLRLTWRLAPAVSIIIAINIAVLILWKSAERESALGYLRSFEIQRRHGDAMGLPVGRSVSTRINRQRDPARITPRREEKQRWECWTGR